jgi:hypothetical protein
MVPFLVIVGLVTGIYLGVKSKVLRTKRLVREAL